MRKLFYLGFLLGVASWAHGFECRSVSANVSGHAAAFDALEELVGRSPAEVYYCTDEGGSRWYARWDVYDTRLGWQKFAQGSCAEMVIGYDCRLTRYVVVAGSHEVIDLPYEVDIARVSELVNAAKTVRARIEVTEIDYRPVIDGGAWSEEDYGYELVFVEPPNFAPANKVIIKRNCDSDCYWYAEFWVFKRLFAHRRQALQTLRRSKADPLIEMRLWEH